MSFELKVWNANKSKLLNTVTEGTPSGIAGGFKWQLRGNGDAVQLDLAGRNDRLMLSPRSVVQLRVDGQPAFYGIVPDPPSSGSPTAEQAQVLGGREALRVTLLDGRAYQNQGVFQIVRDLLSRLCPPALTYDPTLIGDGSGTDAGPGLSLYYAPTSDLVTVLDALAKSAGVTWGVDREGRVFFGRPAAAPLTVVYAGHGWRRLRAQGREAVTRAVLRVVTAPAGLEGADVRYPYAGVPRTVTTVAERPEHALYRAEAAFEPPEGVALVQPQAPARWAQASYYGDGTAGMDGNPDTYATVLVNNPSQQQAVMYEAARGRPVGALVDYSTTGEVPEGALALRLTVSGAIATLTLAATESRRTLRVVLPPETDPPNVVRGEWGASCYLGQVIAATPANPVELRVHEVRFLAVNEALAATTAASFLQLPFASPAELTLPGLLSPSPSCTVTDSPDGDVTGDSPLYEYEHVPGAVRSTKVRLGSDGQSDAARAIKFAVRGAP